MKKKNNKNKVTEEIISQAIDFAEKVTDILNRDSRYDIEAYGFTMSALQYTLSKLKERRHIDGKELLNGIREYALRRFGPMTRTVFTHWGINNTMDFGEIVFNLVEAGLMRKRPEDTKDEFRNVYDFKSAFEEPYRRSTSPRISRYNYKKNK